MDALVLLVAAGFGLMGIGALVRPRLVFDQFGVELGTVEGRNEVRAVYGGFGLAIAAALCVAVLGDSANGDGVLIAVAVALAGMAAGRLVGAAVERPSGLFPVWLYFAIEVLGAAVLLAAV